MPSPGDPTRPSETPCCPRWSHPGQLGTGRAFIALTAVQAGINGGTP
jgi:hypothetical protein